MTGPSGLGCARVRWSFAVAAWLLIGQCAAMPAVSRALDRLSLHDHAGGFKFSQNLERPHEKHTAPGLGAVDAVVAGSPLSAGVDRPAPHTPIRPPARRSAPAALRAPPAR